MLSVVVIARDEADRLGRCLRSVPWATERVVLVDPRTTDATAQMAEREGATVYRHPFHGHVQQKNRALGLATQPWVLSLDADEWLTPTASSQLRGALAAGPPTAGFSFPRCSEWLGKPLRHGRWYPDRKVRAVRKGFGWWTGDNPHDRLEVNGPVSHLRGDIGHQPYRSIWEHLSTIDRYSSVAATQLRERGVRARAWDPPLHGVLHLADAVLRRAAWRDGPEGLVVAALGAAYSGLKWSRLRSLQRPCSS